MKAPLPKFSHHIFICAEPSEAKCCARECGVESWNYLKRRIVELGLVEKVNRTRANCLRICSQGPIVVVYPEGAWYHSCTPQVIEKILERHIIGGQLVEENLLDLVPLS